ncbi:ASC1-like protein [Musa troglodytarum]|uniref:ASC1-like protein n=1 Tax=Musa troglodytarum TaxID=320322 RepID=A0A9E7I646_9LILI|nr:ASC1-like protein [Musa troglodytarum]
MGPIWGSGSGPEPGNFLLVLCFAFGSFVARFLLDRFLYKPCAMRLLGKKAVLMMNDEARWSKVVKCSESMWQLTYYVTVQIWALSIIKQEPWSLDTKEYFKGWPNQELKFFRIGTVMLALHDTSDVFLEAAKLFKYSEKEMAASLCFGLFALSWLILRLVYFPFWIIKSSRWVIKAKWERTSDQDQVLTDSCALSTTDLELHKGKASFGQRYTSGTEDFCSACMRDGSINHSLWKAELRWRHLRCHMSYQSIDVVLSFYHCTQIYR